MIYSKNVRRMKSEKAEELLYRRECGYPYSGYLTTQGAEEVADLAEREAEDRVIAKAIKAHRDCCPLNEFQCLHRDRDDYTCTYACNYVTSFIQKLNKE